MPKLSKSFVFYMKNFETMQALNDFGDENKEAVDEIFKKSGFENASEMVFKVTEKASQTGYNILDNISKIIEEKYKFKVKSKPSTIKDYWYVEIWMHEKKPEKGEGFVLKVEMYEAEKDKKDSKLGLLTCSIYDRRENDTRNLEGVFKKDLKKDYSEVFWTNEWPIFDIYISGNQEEDTIAKEFIAGLSKVLTEENLEKLFAEDRKAKTKPVRKKL